MDRKRIDDREMREQIVKLGHEVHGDRYKEFLERPRRSLDWQTPDAMIDRGHVEPVLRVLTEAVLGDFA